MSTLARISVWEEGNENPSHIPEQKVQSASKSVYVGLSVGVLFGLITLAVVITLWINDMNGKTTVTVTTTSTTSTTITSTSTTTPTSTITTSTTSAITFCSTTAITTTITSSSLPGECFSYTSITDATRYASYTTGATCDTSVFSSATWVRFSGSAGTLLANCPIATSHCGTSATGWYSGVYPSSAGATTTGTVCYNWAGNTCNWSNTISITNCNGYYVFLLTAPPVCSLRYCTI